MRQADRLGAAHAVILDADGGAQLRDMSSGEQREIELRASGRGARRDRDRASVRVSGPAAERLPRRLVRPGARGPGRLRGPGRRLGSPAARPRRADLHRPARPHRPRPARLQPGRAPAAPSSSATSCAPRTSSASPARWCAAIARDRQPRAADGRVRGSRRRGDAAGATPRRRRSRSRASRARWGRRCGFATATSTCAATGCRRRSSFATASPRRFGSS